MHSGVIARLRAAGDDDVRLAALDHALGLADRVAAGRARRGHAEARAVRAERDRDHARRGVGHHHRDEQRRHRPHAAVSMNLPALVLERLQPADAGAHQHGQALRVDVAGQAGLGRRLRRRAHRELRVAIRAPRGLRRHRDVGSNSAHGAPCGGRTARRRRCPSARPIKASKNASAPSPIEETTPRPTMAMSTVSPGCVDARGVTPATPPWNRPGASSARSPRRRTRWLEVVVGDVDLEAVLERLDELDEVERVDVELGPGVFRVRVAARPAP